MFEKKIPREKQNPYLQAALIASSIDEYEEKKQKLLKKAKFKNFFKNKIERVKNFFSNSYESIKENKEYLRQTVGVSLISAIMLGNFNYTNNQVVKETTPQTTKEQTISVDEKQIFVDETKKEKDDKTFYVKEIIINKDFSKQDLKDAARKKGLTGILETISTEKPSYVEGGNIHTLAELARIDLYDEDIEQEKKIVSPQYIGNNINDILFEDDVKEIYKKLKEKETKQKPTEKSTIPTKEYAQELSREKIVSNNTSIDDYASEFQGTITESQEEEQIPPKQLAFIDREKEADKLKLIPKLSQESYKSIAKEFNEKRNKYKAIDEIANKYSMKKDEALEELYNSKTIEGVALKYSKTLKDKVSKEDAAKLLDMYVEGSIKKAKKEYQKMTGLNVDTNFYQAIDDFSDKLNLDKVRKSKLSQTQKADLQKKLKKYA